jgi:hypothetical protein
MTYYFECHNVFFGQTGEATLSRVLSICCKAMLFPVFVRVPCSADVFVGSLH